MPTKPPASPIAPSGGWWLLAIVGLAAVAVWGERTTPPAGPIDVCRQAICDVLCSEPCERCPRCRRRP